MLPPLHARRRERPGRRQQRGRAWSSSPWRGRRRRRRTWPRHAPPPRSRSSASRPPRRISAASSRILGTGSTAPSTILAPLTDAVVSDPDEDTCSCECEVAGADGELPETRHDGARPTVRTRTATIISSGSSAVVNGPSRKWRTRSRVPRGSTAPRRVHRERARRRTARRPGPRARGCRRAFRAYGSGGVRCASRRARGGAGHPEIGSRSRRACRTSAPSSSSPSRSSRAPSPSSESTSTTCVGSEQPKGEQRQQALPAGEQLRLVPRLRQQRECLVDVVRTRVREGRRLHEAPSPACSAAARIGP